MSIKERIDSAVAEAERTDGLSFFEVIPFWSYASLIVLVAALILLTEVFRLVSRESVAAVESGLMVIAGIATVIFMAGLYLAFYEGAESSSEVGQVYQENVVQNFNLTSDDLQDFTTKNFEDSQKVKEATFYYDEDSSNTRYKMLVKFDKNTYEPTLMKTDTVTDKVIEKLKK